MKIETKYDIGQEVYIPYYGEVRKDRILSKSAWGGYKLKNHSNGAVIGKKVIYPTKEACEQAIKEMEV